MLPVPKMCIRDSMYYGNYAGFYEVGRVEMLRSLGLTYSGMEESGIKMPVLELNCKYLKPALYDEEITIRVMKMCIRDSL